MAVLTASGHFFLNRVYLVLSRPIGCWATIARERHEPLRLFGSLALPLIAAGSLLRLSEQLLMGTSKSPYSSLMGLVPEIAALSVAPVLFAWLAARLAPLFQARPDFDGAYSWAVHSLIPCALVYASAAIPGVVPLLCAPAALYACLLLFTGMGPMLFVPRAQSTPFFVTLFVVLILLGACAVLVLAVAPLVLRP